MKKRRRKKVRKKEKVKEPMRDAMSGLTNDQRYAWDSFCKSLEHGPYYIG